MFNGSDKKAFDPTGSALDNVRNVLFTGMTLVTIVIGIAVVVVNTRLFVMVGTIGVFHVVVSLVGISAAGKDTTAGMNSVFTANVKSNDSSILVSVVWLVIGVVDNVLPVPGIFVSVLDIPMLHVGFTV